MLTRVLLVEPYFAGSHRAWAEGFAAHSDHQVDLLTLPGRFWKWRMFGGSLTLAEKARTHLAEHEPPDVILATDMLDLPSYLGHVGGMENNPKTVLYMHENQLTYPLSPTARDDLAYAYMNWSSMVRADEIWFNSQFHLDSVFEALPKFLSHFPDHRHLTLVASVFDKSTVMPVGIDLAWATLAPKTDPPLIMWNQRWEHDKNPARMFTALDRLAATGVEFRVAICGENFRNVPTEFESARGRLGTRIVHYGFAQRPEYERLLRDSAVVLSTAEHEFFGIGAVEAMAAGAVPVFPNHLSYPELVPSALHSTTLYDSNHELDDLLLQAVADEGFRQRIGSQARTKGLTYGWNQVAPEYDTRIAKLG